MRPVRSYAFHPVILVAMAVAPVAIPASARAQSRVEQGENAWHKATVWAAQGNADSALAAFSRAEVIAVAEHDSSLLAAALRGSAEILRTYRGCNDSALALLRSAVAVSIEGDRASALALVRLLATQGQVAEARRVHAAAFADIAGEVPRTITKESVGYLSSLAAIQRAAGQHAAALQSLISARDIAARLKAGDVGDSLPSRAPFSVDYLNYWVMFDMAQLRLTSTTRGVLSAAEGKTIMDAVARSTDEPEEGDRGRFPVFRLADRLAIKAWACQLNGERCPAPQPRGCAK